MSSPKLEFVPTHPIRPLIKASRRLTGRTRPSVHTKHGNKNALTERSKATHGAVQPKPPKYSRLGLGDSGIEQRNIQLERATSDKDCLPGENLLWRSAKLDEDIAQLQAMSRRHPHPYGRRYFKRNRPATVPLNSATVSPLQLLRPSREEHRNVTERMFPQQIAVKICVFAIELIYIYIGPSWHLVKPPSTECRNQPQCSAEILGSSLAPVLECKPRIWTSVQSMPLSRHTPLSDISSQDYSDLIEILPGISKVTNGLSWEGSEIPFLVLEDSTWPEDGWSSGGTTINLSMYGPPSILIV